MQARLEAGGYSVGRHGVDGKIGPDTTAALNKMCQDAGIDPAQLAARPADPQIVARVDQHLKEKAAEKVAGLGDGRRDRDSHATGGQDVADRGAAGVNPATENDGRRDHGSYEPGNLSAPQTPRVAQAGGRGAAIG